MENLPDIDATMELLGVPAEMEARYREAIDQRQRRRVIRLIEQAAGIRDVDALDGVPSAPGAHDAPSPGSGSPLYDVCQDGTYPEDIYSIQGLRLYGVHERLDHAAWHLIQQFEAHPNQNLAVYRAIPADGQRGIHPGAWVTPLKAYAIEHGRGEFPSGHVIVSITVKARDLFTSGDSWLEYGYHPQGFKPEPPRSDEQKARSLAETASRFLYFYRPDLLKSLAGEAAKQPGARMGMSG